MTGVRQYGCDRQKQQSKAHVRLRLEKKNLWTEYQQYPFKALHFYVYGFWKNSKSYHEERSKSQDLGTYLSSSV